MKKLAFSAFMATLCIGTAHAETITFSTTDYSQSSIGQDPGVGGAYDQFSIAGVTNQSVTFSGSSIVTIGQYSFVVGVNCTTCQLTPSYDAVFNMTIGAQTKTFDIPYSWSSTGPTDTLTFGAPAPITFNVGSELITVTGINPGALSSGGETLTGNVQATLTGDMQTTSSSVSAVPEPETYAMLLAGLGLIGFMTHRKSGKKAV